METNTIHKYFVDLHVHIGRTEKGQPVKISGSKDLTFRHIAEESSERKGIQVIGIIDSHSPDVQEEILQYMHCGEMSEVSGGGIRYRNTTILLGSEIEVRDPGLGPAHLLAYLPTLEKMQQFTGWMSRHMKNVNLSSQRIYVPARVLQAEVLAMGGIVIPAHVFTPHKSVYGSCVTRIEELLDLDGISAIELGLSSDSAMASHISETDRYSFVSNSDAHSLGKIGREYNIMGLAEPTFEEVCKALTTQDGRSIIANYGLNPRLGKYHRSYCAQCESIMDEEQIAAQRCLYCGHPKIIRGVMDRIIEIADRETPQLPANRPQYHYQVPLEFIPGLGRRSIHKLLDQLGTEMNIIHHASIDQLTEIVGESIAEMIIAAREGTLHVHTGGGGQYGKVTKA